MAKKILVVEDFEDAREPLVLYLRRLGYEVFEAADGIEALEQAAVVHPDLILMDLSMPRMTGLEATAHLKQDPATRDIPVIVLTAHSGSALKDSAIEAGALEVLLKPIDFKMLGENLGRYLRPERAQQPLPDGSDSTTTRDE